MDTEGKTGWLKDLDVALLEIGCGKPHWPTLTEDVVCPLCQYNLRGLDNPRCPECGYEFSWPDLLDPSRRKHPYLFDQQRGLAFGFFCKTAFYGLRPRKFWKLVRADQACDVDRLGLYWILVNLFFLAAIASQYLFAVLDSNIQNWSRFSGWTTSPSRLPRFGTSWYWPNWNQDLAPVLIPIGIILIWPWLTALTLMIFQVSMRRARINPVHVIRCIVYSSDIVFLLSVITLIVSVASTVLDCIQYLNMTNNNFLVDREIYITIGCWAIALPVFIYRMIMAYWHYLRFRHVIATIISTQIIVALVILTVMIYVAWSMI